MQGQHMMCDKVQSMYTFLFSLTCHSQRTQIDYEMVDLSKSTCSGGWDLEAAGGPAHLSQSCHLDM